MPVAHINVLEGHPRATLRRLIGDVSQAMARILQSPTERLEVWITEIDSELWGVSGVPASDALRQYSRADVEMPFVQMVLLEGRSPAQHHALIVEVTEIIARLLGTKQDRIRIHIAEASPDRWGIGGVPASVKRAGEIAARAAAAVHGDGGAKR
jgi:4-oxalocrotonate tautomerase family enzyme